MKCPHFKAIFTTTINSVSRQLWNPYLNINYFWVVNRQRKVCTLWDVFFNTRLSKDLVRLLVHYFLADTLIPVYYCSILEMNKILFSLTQSSNYLLINRHSLVSQIYLNLATYKDFVVSIDIEKRENMWQWFILSRLSSIYLYLKKLVIPYICG